MTARVTPLVALGLVVAAADGELAAARKFQRDAQFHQDFVEAENSTGFHAPQEAERILPESIDYARQGHDRGIE